MHLPPRMNQGMKAVFFRALLLAALGAWAAGCGSGAPLEACGSDADCGACERCIDGNCWLDVTCVLPCEPPCATPPPAACLDGTTLRVYRGQGECVQGECAYPFVDIACTQACQDGACLGEPCAGKLCDTPPGICFAAQGVCRPESGVCDYPLADDGTSCDDADACTQADACQSGQCRGTPVACSTPPAPACLDAGTLRAYSLNGSCADGACGYPTQDIICPEGCVNDTCVGDPCAGVVCTTPPSPCFEPVGECRSGMCNYAIRDGASCDDHDACTTGDRCLHGVCLGVPRVCATPPDNTCLDADTMRSYSINGACRDDGCEYHFQDVACAQGCTDGRCVGDPCAGLVCDQPPNACYMQLGTCAEGSCVYPPLNSAACDDGDPCTLGDVCQHGTCRGLPQSCDRAPADECLDGEVLRAYAAAGACQAGACYYWHQDVTCAYGCVGGFCVGDACHGLTCDTPPNDCHARFGSCVQGVCRYAPLEGVACDDSDACTQGDACSAGVCRGTLIRCDQPPADTCLDAIRLRVYSPNGSCAAGACSYPYQDVSCAESCMGGRCGGGSCPELSLGIPADVNSEFDAGPRVVVAGQGPFGLFWEQRVSAQVQVMFRSVNADGSFGGAARGLGAAAMGTRSVACSDAAYGIAPYLDGGPSELWRVDASGNLLGKTPLGAESRMTPLPPAVAWGGDRWAAAVDSDLALVAPTGQLTRPGVGGLYSSNNSLVWTGSEYGLAWVEFGASTGATHFQRVSATGAALGQPFEVGGAVCMDGCQSLTALAWTGSEFLLGYRAEDGLHLARLVPAGDTVSVLSDRLVEQAAEYATPYSLAYNPARGEVALVYGRYNLEEMTELVLARCAPDGTGCTRVVLGEGLGSAGTGFALADGQEYVVAWSQMGSTYGRYRIRFARLGCTAPAP